MRLEYPLAGKIQQGAIFNCAVVSGYHGCPAYGIVLTARCDLEHHKCSVISYLPVVRFSDWVLRNLCPILATKQANDLKRDIYTVLEKHGVSQTILNTFPLADVIQREAKDSEKPTLLEKGRKLELMLGLSSLIDTPCPNAKEVIKMAGKSCEKTIKDLIQQKLGDYYFLESVDVVSSVTDGFVVLLRHMRTMDCVLMERIVAGMTVEDAQSADQELRDLSFDHDPICMISGVLRSPDIEHLAQQFANIFVRIGLEDHQQTTLDRHIAATKAL